MPELSRQDIADRAVTPSACAFRRRVQPKAKAQEEVLFSDLDSFLYEIPWQVSQSIALGSRLHSNVSALGDALLQ